jgi:hypothetical protein
LYLSKYFSERVFTSPDFVMYIVNLICSIKLGYVKLAELDLVERAEFFLNYQPRGILF